MKVELPSGYGLDFGDADTVILIGPGGRPTGHRYTPAATSHQFVADAREHRAKANPCIDWDCPVCRERGLIPDRPGPGAA